MFKTKLYVLLFSIVLAQAANAKDPLIPSNLDGYSSKTQFDYSKLTKKLLDALPAHQRKALKKQVYGYDPDNKKYDFYEYLRVLNDKKLDLTPRPEEKVEKDLEFAIDIPPEEAKTSDYFNTVNLKTQLKLKCPVTPSLKFRDPNMPKQFQPTNNLRRYSKSPEIAAGDIIYIKGQVRDVNCTPIPGAVVELWHADAYGDYKNRGSDDKNFVGAGMAVADNMGNFSFITVMPEEYITQSFAESILAPHLGMKISHDKFPNIATRMYFPKHVLNHDDQELNSLDKFSKNLIVSEIIPVNFNNYSEGYLMLFDITLDGVSAYRHL